MTNVPNFIAGITGYEGGGKSRMAFTMPKEPSVKCKRGGMAILSTDTNTETTLRAYLKIGADDDFPDWIQFQHVSMPTLAFDEQDDVRDESGEKWDAIRDFLRPMVKNPKVRPRSLILDTAVDVYDLRVLAKFGKLDQISPETRRNMMGQVNTGYKGVLQAMKEAGVSVCLVHRAKDKWVDKTVRTQSGIKDERTRLEGPFDMEMQGFKDTRFLTGVEVHVAFDATREGKLAGKFGMKVTRASQRPGIIGKEYWGREKIDNAMVVRASFPYLMTKVFPQTTLQDWA